MPTIYKDALGRLDSKANISVFGSKCGEPGTGYLKLTSTSNCPSRKWGYLSHDVSHIVAEMEADGWICVVARDGYNAPKIDCTHIATQAVIDNAKNLSDKKFINAERGYIRFGSVPKNGYSFNHRDKTQEPGVSVFNAEFAANNDYRVLLNDVLEVTYLNVADRQAYRVYGDVVGSGADGEPVVKVLKIVKLK